MRVDDDTRRSILAQAWGWIAEGWFENARCMGLLYVSTLEGNGAELLRHQHGWPIAPAVANEPDFFNGSIISAGDGVEMQ